MREFKGYELVSVAWTLEVKEALNPFIYQIWLGIGWKRENQYWTSSKFLGAKYHLMLNTINLRNCWKCYDPFFSFSTLSHDPSETQNLSISSLYFAPSYNVHSWSSFLLKLPHKTCVICEGMHSTLRAQVIFDIPSSLPSLTRHVMCFKLDQREANSLLAAQWILILLAATAEQWLQVHSIAKDFTPLWGSVEVVYVGRVSWSRF